MKTRVEKLQSKVKSKLPEPRSGRKANAKRKKKRISSIVQDDKRPRKKVRYDCSSLGHVPWVGNWKYSRHGWWNKEFIDHCDGHEEGRSECSGDSIDDVGYRQEDDGEHRKYPAEPMWVDDWRCGACGKWSPNYTEICRCGYGSGGRIATVKEGPGKKFRKDGQRGWSETQYRPYRPTF